METEHSFFVDFDEGLFIMPSNRIVDPFDRRTLFLRIDCISWISVDEQRQSL